MCGSILLMWRFCLRLESSEAKKGPKKSKKGAFLALVWIFDLLARAKKLFKNLKTLSSWPDVSSFSVQNLMAIQLNASRAGQTMDLGDLLVQKKLFDSINWYHIFCTFHWQESFLFCSGTTVGQQRVLDFQKIIHWQLLKNVFLANCFLF